MRCRTVAVPGNGTTAKTDVLEAGAALLQSKAPLEAINTCVNGFHFASGGMQARMEAHHFCATACCAVAPQMPDLAAN